MRRLLFGCMILSMVCLINGLLGAQEEEDETPALAAEQIPQAPELEPEVEDDEPENPVASTEPAPVMPVAVQPISPEPVAAQEPSSSAQAAPISPVQPAMAPTTIPVVPIQAPVGGPAFPIQLPPMPVVATPLPSATEQPVAPTQPEVATPLPSATAQQVVPTPAALPQPPVSGPAFPIQLPPKPVVATPLPSATAPAHPAPAKPAVVAKAPMPSRAQPQEGELQPEGIDTVDLAEPSGNWLYKRIWWEKAEDKYEKIRNLVERIFEGRMIFFTQRTELDRSVFDPFYLNAGLGRGELEELLNYLMSEMEAQRTKLGTLTEQERAFLNTMTKEKETLEQLKLDIEAISKIDAAVDDALSKLMEQLNLCRSYEQKAWEAFKEIAQVLNDKKARELYYAMVTHEDNISAIGNYLRSVFADHFNKLAATAKEHVARVQTTIQKLKEKGIDFQKKAHELENQMSKEERARLEREKEEAIERALEEEQASKGWGSWFLGLFKSAWNGITGAASSVYSTVLGWFGKAPEEEVVQEVEVEVSAPASMSQPQPALQANSSGMSVQTQVPPPPVLPQAPTAAPLQAVPHEE